MTRAVIMAAALGACLAGCTKVPDLNPGDCGNRIVESDEDCDGFAGQGLECGAPDTENECAFVCNPNADAVACPPDWQCGQDRRCRQPTGTFDVERTSTLQFSAEDLAVGDIDGNGYIDIVGNQSSRVTMRLGSGSALLADERDVLVPEPVGPLLFDYVDEDPRLDVIVPIQGGLFTLVGDARPSLEPVPYASLQLSPLGGIRTLTVEAFPDDRDLELLALTNDGMVFFEADSTSAQVFPDGGTIAELARDVAVGNIDDDAQSEVVLAFDGERLVHICQGQVAMSGNEGSLQTVCGTPLDVNNPIDATGGTRFADVNGDGALDLLASVTVEGEKKVTVALGDGLGTFARSEVAEIFSLTEDQGGGAATRADPWPIAIVDLDGAEQGDAAHDYVFSKDIMLVNASGDVFPERGIIAKRANQDTWTSAAITDINDDGRLDVAVSLAQLDGIDFFRNVREDEVVGVVFNEFRRDTDGPPRLLRSGDFDGDQVGDVAFVLGELDDDQPNQIAVSFGDTSGSPSEPVAMGNFGKLEVLEPIDTSLAAGDFDTITDLAVVFSTTDPVARQANVLRGDSSRRMLSPFFLFTRNEEFDLPQGVALGSFGSLGVGSPTALDLLVIGKHLLGFRAWLLAGTGTGGGLGAFGFQADLPASDELDYGCALWRAGDLDGNPGDEVVGIDSSSGCASGASGEAATIVEMKIDPGAFNGSGAATLSPVITDLGPELVNVRALHLHDMDLDGNLDIVAAFQGDDDSGIGARAVIFWNNGGSFDLLNDRTVIESPPFVFYDAAPIRFGSAAPELILLSEGVINGDTRRLILRVSANGSRSYDPPEPLAERGSNGHLAVADLDGDGLEDIVYTDGDNAHVILQRPGPPLGSQDTEGAAQ
jgi:hypothetical protein